MKHGLFFGGFYPQVGDIEFGLPENRLQGYNSAYDADFYEEVAAMVIYRATGNHKLATHLRKQNWDCEVLDYTTEFEWHEIISYIDERITDETVFCGWSVVFAMHPSARERVNDIIAYCKKKYPHVIHIAGGWYGRLLSRINADYWVIGNAEHAMDAILKKHTGMSDDIEHLHPITNRNGHKGYLIDAVHQHTCYPKKDANCSYEDRDYIQPYECLIMELARGCRFSCKYCTYPLIGMKGVTHRDAQSVHDELLENYERWGVENYYLIDDTVNDTKEKMEMLAQASRPLPFQPFIAGYARFDLLASHGEKTWEHMCEAGFTSHHYGIETMNHEAGKIIGKGMHPDKVKDKLLEVEEYFQKNAPTAYCGSMTLIVGLEKETLKSLDETHTWLEKYWEHQRVGWAVLDLDPHEQDDFARFDINNMGGKLHNEKEVDRYGTSDYTFYKASEVKSLMTSPDIANWFYASKRFRNRDHIEDGTVWIHPSKEYDMIDAIDVAGQNVSERTEAGRHPETAFRIHIPLLVDYGKKRDTEMKKYFHRYPKQRDFSPIKKHIAEYKRKKLNKEYQR